MSGLILAVPFSLAVGAPVSALLLDVNWFGLAGWKWLFIVAGLPAVVMGFVTFFYLTDHPRQAKWLTENECDHLENVLAAEIRQKEALGKVTIGQALRERNLWLLALGILAANTGGYALNFWLPTTVKNNSGGMVQATLFYSCVVYTCGLASVLTRVAFSTSRCAKKQILISWRKP